MRRVIEIAMGKCICVHCGYELFLNPINDPNKFVEEFICSQCNNKFFKKEEESTNVKSTIK